MNSKHVLGTYVACPHQIVQQGGVEPGVQLTPEHGGRYIEAAAYLALRKAVYELSGVVRQLARVAVGLAEFFLGDHTESE